MHVSPDKGTVKSRHVTVKLWERGPFKCSTCQCHIKQAHFMKYSFSVRLHSWQIYKNSFVNIWSHFMIAVRKMVQVLRECMKVHSHIQRSKIVYVCCIYPDKSVYVQREYKLYD